jgi:hypothetical protein
MDSRSPPEEALASPGQSVEDLQQAYYQRAKAHLEGIDARLAKKTTWNFYRASTIAFLHSCIRDFTGTTQNISLGTSRALSATSIDIICPYISPHHNHGAQLPVWRRGSRLVVKMRL